MTKAVVKQHTGNPNECEQDQGSFRPMNYESMLEKQLRNGTEVMICVTMYNESYHQLILTLAGIYRNYYELCAVDKNYEGKVSVVIISDGYSTFNSIDEHDEHSFSRRMARAGIYDEERSRKYVKKLDLSVLMKPQTQYLDLKFIRKDPD